MIVVAIAIGWLAIVLLIVAMIHVATRRASWDHPDHDRPIPYALTHDPRGRRAR